jgi:hypothetical protein
MNTNREISEEETIILTKSKIKPVPEKNTTSRSITNLNKTFYYNWGHVVAEWLRHYAASR